MLGKRRICYDSDYRLLAIVSERLMEEEEGPDAEGYRGRVPGG